MDPETGSLARPQLVVEVSRMLIGLSLHDCDDSGRRPSFSWRQGQTGGKVRSTRPDEGLRGARWVLEEEAR